MFSLSTLLGAVLCSLVILTHSHVTGPKPFDVSIRTRVSHPEEGRPPLPDGVPEPPGAPGTDGVGPVPPFGFGDRCPFPLEDSGDYLIYCIKYIGSDCECIFDDIHIPQAACALSNLTQYEMLAGYQMEQEKTIDDKRVEEGHKSSAEGYVHVLDCLDKAREIVAKSETSGETEDEGEGGEETSQEENETEE